MSGTPPESPGTSAGAAAAAATTGGWRDIRIAFNFFGTFTSRQLEDFVKFSHVQEADIESRAAWLESEIDKVGTFVTEYDEDDKYPVYFDCFPRESYGSKLLLAYKILGGVPERDMLLRTSDKPVFLKKGVNASPTDPDSGYSRDFSNGRVYRGTQRFDRSMGLRVDALKKWQLEAVKRKREHLELKIKRALDYSDQLKRELDLLNGLKGGGVSDLVTEIYKVMLMPGAMSVVDDSDDGFGLGVGPVGDKFVDSPTAAKSKKYRGF